MRTVLVHALTISLLRLIVHSRFASDVAVAGCSGMVGARLVVGLTKGEKVLNVGHRKGDKPKGNPGNIACPLQDGNAGGVRYTGLASATEGDVAVHTPPQRPDACHTVVSTCSMACPVGSYRVPVGKSTVRMSALNAVRGDKAG